MRTRTLLWKGKVKTMVFAFQGWSGDRARNVTNRRDAFGTCTGVASASKPGIGKRTRASWTTSRDPVYRLLLEGIAYLLRKSG